jgi:D-glycero-alpha-D-manno-heptose-7-phosphate kinase
MNRRQSRSHIEWRVEQTRCSILDTRDPAVLPSFRTPARGGASDPTENPNLARTIRATTPARIDLAGGTLDIYPLYLFEEFGVTVNAAINLGSEVTVEERSDKKIVLHAEDISVKQSAKNLEALDVNGELPLLARIARHYLEGYGKGVTVTTRNKAPKGSGLGASSCLLIAMSGALNELTGRGYDKQRIILVGSELEAQVIRIPTGKQDYYAAAYGGVNAIWFHVGEDRVEPLGEAAVEELNKRIVLSFTGVSHFSGTSNWAMMRRYIGDQGDTQSMLRAIKNTAMEMRGAIKDGKWNDFAQIVDEEWQNRRQLARGVTNAKIEKIMGAAKGAGALSSKICGAGGGGCMITVIRPEDREKVSAAIEGARAQILPLEVQAEGLVVRG